MNGIVRKYIQFGILRKTYPENPMRAQVCYVPMLKGEVESAELEILKGRVAISFCVFVGLIYY